MESHVEVPHDWDTPVPRTARNKKDDISFVSIPDDIESQLQREASSASLAKYGTIGHRNR